MNGFDIIILIWEKGLFYSDIMQSNRHLIQAAVKYEQKFACLLGS